MNSTRQTDITGSFRRGPLASSLDERSDEAYAAFSFDPETPSETGVLVIHGFTGSPTSMARLGRVFADAGFHVRLPLLTGHGTDPADLASTPRSAWIEDVDGAYRELASRCTRILVVGLSMGGALALNVAARHRVDGVVVINPGLVMDQKVSALAPVLKFVVPYVDSIGNDMVAEGVDERAYPKTPVAAVAQLRALMKETRALLPEISAPVLAFLSDTDHVVSPASGKALAAGLQSGLLRVVRLSRSYHVATMDQDADLIFAKSLEFARSLQSV